jgi:uridine phosphorylase
MRRHKRSLSFCAVSAIVVTNAVDTINRGFDGRIRVGIVLEMSNDSFHSCQLTTELLYHWRTSYLLATSSSS